MPWAKRTSRAIPSIGVASKEFPYNDYRGVNTYIANDVLKDGFWRLAQDARFITLGNYGTRQGFDYHTDAAGETEDQTVTSTTGAADQSFSDTVRLAQKYTAGASGRVSKIEVRLKNDASATGTVIVALYSDSSGSPGTLLGKTSIAASTPTGSYAYIPARVASAPQQASGTAYWVVCWVQSTASGSYKWSSTTSATTAKSSTDSGNTWSATSYALNFKVHYATDSVPKGLHRAYKSDGTSRTLLAHGTALYGGDDGTGALTSLKTGLDSSATKYRFCTVNDIVYYVNGFDGIRKLAGANFATESQVSTTDASIVVEHKGLLFFVDAADPNKVFYSNFADYETFTSTDFIYVPSPKTGDPVVAMRSLNGTLVIWTRNKKYVLYGADNATFQLEPAPGQKGTFSQETTEVYENFAYFLGDDGVYRFNGTTDELISSDNYDDVRTAANKDGTVICPNKGRLYVWYAASGSAVNNRCWVYNLTFNKFESLDTDAFVAFAANAFNDDDKMLVCNSAIGQAYWQELSTNDYTNLGGDINFELRSHYRHFGNASRYKQVRFLKSRFKAQSGAYNISISYATDLRDSFNLITNVPVQGSGSLWGTAVWGAFTWGTTAEVESSNYIPGEYKRIAVQYKHYATRQPHNFYGDTFIVQIRSNK